MDPDLIVNKDNTVKRKTLIMVICVFIIATSIFSWKMDSWNTIKCENKIDRININTSKIKMNYINATEIIKTKQNEIDKLTTVIENIKDENDFLQRDIKLYIETTHPRVPTIVVDSIAENIVELSKKYNISPELIVGIIKVESSFNPMAVGPKTDHGHARGLMQIMPEWVKKLKLKNQYNFHEINIGIESGIKVFLIHLKEAKGDISTGLYYYVNKDKLYVNKVYAAIGRFVAFRSTIDDDSRNVETDIDVNGDLKELLEGEEGEKKNKS